ncbi:protein HHL1, chloroplastic-like [Daucus carota subsp. sativus]|uniref:protein HHL1, chloroplastic-like n=1 Tax=Daucus carota subsp. sativus TaxID=79200 RepID=UPI0007EF84A3|nr:PREDICTED: protein HHL1, chloroplastic-like [Daucus carota subsp. sativus]
METSLSLNALIRIPNSKSCSSSLLATRNEENGLIRCSFIVTRMRVLKNQGEGQRGGVMVAKAKKNKSGGMQSRRSKRPTLPSMPKIEEDDNPRFVIFIRMANVYVWYPLSIVSGGSTAKIILAAKDTFVGKYIYKDTLARNLGAVIYKDEKEIQKTAIQQHRVLRSATEFRYGYKIVENGNMKAAISPNDVVELPRREELKPWLIK